ncbi:MAG: flagellar motor stator protein MotA [Burkholderiales bacterium]|nr:flagellar motor stator protein MotA [Burkholderiales bacterium]
MFVIIGWVLALACIFGVFIAHEGNIMVILHALPFELITIFGAAAGAFLANNQMKVVKASLAGLGKCFKGSKYSKARYMELMALMYDILQKARKEGLMSIEKDVEDPHNSPLFQKFPNVGNDHHVVEFITDYLRMMVSGNLNAHEIESLMDSEIDTHHAEEHAAVAAIARLAGGLPAFGIVAAVLGVVNTMGSVGQPPAVLGGMIGSALVGTFLGILLSYGFFAPMAGRMEFLGEAESVFLRTIASAIVALSTGESPKGVIMRARRNVATDCRPGAAEMAQVFQ